ncbi:MAG: 2OG-Fe dioxygenase family protein [Pseudomonadota bacterium]|nr:2OG-Fe dioxygenase family protein [Pseudomonadota bacterium]
MVATFPAPFTTADDLQAHLRDAGYAVLSPVHVGLVCGCPMPALDALVHSWNDLQPDHYLKDGGSYRRRRHSCFVVEETAASDWTVTQSPHRAHWQSEEYNALHGGMRRWFEPISDEVAAQPAWSTVLQCLAQQFSVQKKVRRWYVEAHQFRIDTSEGIGRPTPEGAHRDGVDFVAVFLVARQGIKGGETRVFEAAGPNGQRFTLAEPWSLLLLDDARVIHESTPIQPEHEHGHRDTLVLTYRAGGFQGDD